MREYLATVQTGLHEDYLNASREKLALFTHDFESNEYPGYI